MHARRRAERQLKEKHRPLRINRFLYGNFALLGSNRKRATSLASARSHMGTKVPIQLPFWGGVSPLQPARSAAFSPPPPLPPGNRPIPPRHGDSRAASGGCAAAPRPYAANAARSPTLPNVRLRPVRRRVLMHGYVPSVPWFPGSGFAAGFRELTRKRLVRPRLHAEASRPPHFSGEGLSPVGRRHRKRAQFGLSPFSLSFHAALSLSLRAATSAGDIVTTG